MEGATRSIGVALGGPAQRRVTRTWLPLIHCLRSVAMGTQNFHAACYGSYPSPRRSASTRLTTGTRRLKSFCSVELRRLLLRAVDRPWSSSPLIYCRGGSTRGSETDSVATARPNQPTRPGVAAHVPRTGASVPPGDGAGGARRPAERGAEEAGRGEPPLRGVAGAESSTSPPATDGPMRARGGTQARSATTLPSGGWVRAPHAVAAPHGVGARRPEDVTVPGQPALARGEVALHELRLARHGGAQRLLVARTGVARIEASDRQPQRPPTRPGVAAHVPSAVRPATANPTRGGGPRAECRGRLDRPVTARVVPADRRARRRGGGTRRATAPRGSRSGIEHEPARDGRTDAGPRRYAGSLGHDTAVRRVGPRTARGGGAAWRRCPPARGRHGPRPASARARRGSAPRTPPRAPWRRATPPRRPHWRSAD